jgi:hypothetical protein
MSNGTFSDALEAQLAIMSGERSVFTTIQQMQEMVLGYEVGDSVIAISKSIPTGSATPGYIGDAEFEMDWGYSYEDRYNYISSGQITLIKDSFYDYWENLVDLYYPFSYIDEPTIEWDTDHDPPYTEFTYDDDEIALFNEKFDATEIETGEESLLEYVGNKMIALTEQMVNTKVSAQFIAKKTKNSVLNEDNLSSFTEEEAAQGISLSVAYKITEEEEEALAEMESETY